MDWTGQMHAVAFYDWKAKCDRKEQALQRTKAALRRARYASWAHCFTVWASGVRARLVHAAKLSRAINRWSLRSCLWVFRRWADRAARLRAHPGR